MMDDKIYFVPPIISELAATEILNPSKKWWQLRKKILNRVELVFMPFYYFELRIESKKSGCQRISMVVDGIGGVFSLFDQIEFTEKNSFDIPAFQFQINSEQARQICLNEYKRAVLNYSLKQHVFIEIKEIVMLEKIFYPFWIGYLSVGKKYDFQTIDAVNGKFQGLKMRRAFLGAFSQSLLNLKN